MQLDQHTPDEGAIALLLDWTALEAAAQRIYEDKGDRVGKLYAGWNAEPEEVKAEWIKDCEVTVQAYIAAQRPASDGTFKDPNAIEHYDNDARVYLDGYNGGAHCDGAWSELTLRFVAPDGTESRRSYRDKALAPASDGWRLVPVEPTPDMLAMADEAMCDTVSSDDWIRHAQNAWKAMLAAAPAPPGATASLPEPGADGEVERLKAELAEAQRLRRAEAAFRDLDRRRYEHLTAIRGGANAAAIDACLDDLATAIRPFAAEVEDWEGQPEYKNVGETDITIGDLRRAQIAFAKWAALNGAAQ